MATMLALLSHHKNTNGVSHRKGGRTEASKKREKFMEEVEYKAIMRNIRTAAKPKRQSPTDQKGKPVKKAATQPITMKGSQKTQLNRERAAVLLKS